MITYGIYESTYKRMSVIYVYIYIYISTYIRIMYMCSGEYAYSLFYIISLLFSLFRSHFLRPFSLPHNGKNNKAIIWSFPQRKVHLHT